MMSGVCTDSGPARLPVSPPADRRVATSATASPHAARYPTRCQWADLVKCYDLRVVVENAVAELIDFLSHGPALVRGPGDDRCRPAVDPECFRTGSGRHISLVWLYHPTLYKCMGRRVDPRRSRVMPSRTPTGRFSCPNMGRRLGSSIGLGKCGPAQCGWPAAAWDALNSLFRP